jgi:hypothetical protein
VLSLPCDAQGFFLMKVENKIFAEEARGFGQNDALARERFQVASALECRIQLKDRIGPQATLVELFGDKLGEVGIEDINEALYVALVFADDLVT